MEICLRKFDIYQGAVAPYYFKSHANSWCYGFFSKNVTTDVRSEIHLVSRNIVSTGQSARALRKIIFRPVL